MTKINNKAIKLAKLIESLAKLNNTKIKTIKVSNILFVCNSGYEDSVYEDSVLDLQQIAKNNDFISVPAKDIIEIENVIRMYALLSILRPKERNLKKSK